MECLGDVGHVESGSVRLEMVLVLVQDILLGLVESRSLRLEMVLVLM